jgi:hypothetical protein
MLIHHSEHLFSKIKETVSVKDVKKWLDVTCQRLLALSLSI